MLGGGDWVEKLVVEMVVLDLVTVRGRSTLRTFKRGRVMSMLYGGGC